MTKADKAEAKLAKIVKNVMAHKPPKGSLKKPVKIPGKADLKKMEIGNMINGFRQQIHNSHIFSP